MYIARREEKWRTFFSPNDDNLGVLMSTVDPCACDGEHVWVHARPGVGGADLRPIRASGTAKGSKKCILKKVLGSAARAPGLVPPRPSVKRTNGLFFYRLES